MHPKMAIVVAIVVQNRRGKNTYILFSSYGSILKVISRAGALQWTDSSTKKTQRAPKNTHTVMAIVMAIVRAVVDQNRRGKNIYIFFSLCDSTEHVKICATALQWTYK